MAAKDIKVINIIIRVLNYEQDKENKPSFKQKAQEFFDREIKNSQGQTYQTKYFVELALAINKQFLEKYKEILKKITGWRKRLKGKCRK